MNGQFAVAQAASVWIFASALVLLFGTPLIRSLHRLGAGQRVRDDGPQRHLQKEGTPTMGGLLIVGAAAVAVVGGQFWLTRTLQVEVIVLVAALLAFAAIGAADDWMKIARGRSLGLKAREKLALQFAAAVAFVYALHGLRLVEAAGAGDPMGGLTAGWMVFWVIAIALTSNAVNLADGLDGLAAGVCTVAALGFVVLSVREEAISTALVAAALGGACLGFLFFNRHPARVFMGDVGSLALGGSLAATAAALDAPVALLGLCLIPYLEAGSVIVQVISFKTTGKRVFKMSPVHHHFELSGWSEQRVVRTFWAVALLGAAVVVGWSLLA
ncbi:MAG: phospho-N-acetylmuramoyl-pentapeptide-transferase [Armatimonadetes bacterium]|nr:phospho-N-acetylmuramoyl-pentapeptide-transferase [Armatimonadota bacterium]